MLSRDFILAGNATFTVSSLALEGGHRTYRVCKVEFKDKPTGNERLNQAMRERPRVFYFAKLLRGPDNTRDYTYMGRVQPETGKLTATNKSPDGVEKWPAWQYLAGVLMAIWTGEDLEGIDVAHAGKCGRCGRLLTDPVSVELGIGPVCRERLS